MDSWLIPAAPVIVVEEIKKSRFITLLAHTDGVEAAKAFVESVKMEHPDATIVWRGWRARPMTRSSWDFQTMANRQVRQANRCSRS